jgi:hypothetical protein
MSLLKDLIFKNLQEAQGTTQGSKKSPREIQLFTDHRYCPNEVKDCGMWIKRSVLQCVGTSRIKEELGTGHLNLQVSKTRGSSEESSEPSVIKR